MSFPNYKYGTGLSNVGSYQSSGKPFVSGGLDASETMSVEFPSVSRWIYVVNNTTDVCRVGFSELGVDDTGTNYFTVRGETASERFEVKVSQVWLSGSGDVDVFAGLTGISPDRITNISPSGSNWSGSAGIG
jgi:hypothetical protein